MKCPKCNDEMIKSHGSWLCLNCGHSEPTAGNDPAGPEPVAATADPTDVATPAPAVPVPVPSAPRHFSPKLAAIVGGATVAVILVATAVYLFVFAPQTALGGYLQKLSGAKAVGFASTLSAKVPDVGNFDIKVSGGSDTTDNKNPKADINLSGTASGTTISAEIRLLAKTLYFKIGSLGFLNQYLSTDISKDWYKYTTSDSASTSKCTASGAADSWLGSSIITKIPVKNASFKGLDTIVGATTLHYVGTIDNSKIQKAIDDANKKLSADCKITTSADDFKDIVISYDLWRGWSKDRISFTVADAAAKSSYNVTVDTSDYNKAVKVDAPKDAKDFSTIFQSMFGGTGSDTSGTSDSTASKEARDVQRKSDLRSVQKALEEYFVSNAVYPVTDSWFDLDVNYLTAGEPPILKTMPNDPLDTGIHVYQYSGTEAAYTLRACLENTSDTGQYTAADTANCGAGGRSFTLYNNN